MRSKVFFKFLDIIDRTLESVFLLDIEVNPYEKSPSTWCLEETRRHRRV